MDIVFGIVTCICIVCVWGSILLVQKKKGRRISTGQLVSSIGITVICISLMLRSFELLPRSVYFVMVGIGILTEIAALVLILKRREI